MPLHVSRVLRTDPRRFTGQEAKTCEQLHRRSDVSVLDGLLYRLERLGSDRRQPGLMRFLKLTATLVEGRLKLWVLTESAVQGGGIRIHRLGGSRDRLSGEQVIQCPFLLGCQSFRSGIIWHYVA